MREFLDWFSSTIWPWVIVAVHSAVVLIASGHVVLTKRDSRAAIGWIGIIWLTPIVGSLLYFSFGINRIQRKARILRSGQHRGRSKASREAAEEKALRRAIGDDCLQL